MNNKKKAVLIGAVAVAVGLGALAAMQFRGSAAEGESTPVAQAAVLEERQLQAVVNGTSVDGRVVPVQQADLSLPLSGVVAEVLAAEGDAVEAGQVLVRLQAAQQQAALAQAEAQLARAQARLTELKAGARVEELAAARSAADAAQARLDRIQNGPLSAEAAAAQAGLAEAQASLQAVLEGAGDQQLIAAQTEVANAEAVLRQAQAAYDRVAGDPEIGARPESIQLEQATNAANAARARLADLQQGASDSEVAAARARVQQAQAQLDLVNTSNPASIAEAEANLRQAQAQLDLLAAGVRPESLAVAEAEVWAAEAAVAQARAAVADTELRAPFAGTVAALSVAAGEPATAGAPIVSLADLSRWQIETEDLTEFEAVGVKAGDEVTITFDAIPGLEKAGIVNRVRPIGQDNRGDIVYTVVVDPTEHDQRLLWNMTAVVTLDEK